MSQSDLPLSYGDPLPSDYESLSRAELTRRLTVFIHDLLETNFEKLANLIYRHDIDERLFNQALEEESIELQAAAIAKLVINRELQKIETRKKYRKEQKGGQTHEIE